MHERKSVSKDYLWDNNAPLQAVPCEPTYLPSRSQEDNVAPTLSKTQERKLDALIESLSGEHSELVSENIQVLLATLQQRKIKAQHEEEKAERTRQAAEQRRAVEAEESRIDAVTSMELPLDWENAFAADIRAQPGTAVDAYDGLTLSLVTLGRVDIEYIASVSRLSCQEVIGQLKGRIYQNPETWGECFYKGWELADEYLSGNLMRKRRAAAEASRTYHGYFDANVRALDESLPAPIDPRDIYITLGSPWVPPRIMNQFIVHILAPKYECTDLEFAGVIHDEITGTWEVQNRGSKTFVANETYPKRFYSSRTKRKPYDVIASSYAAGFSTEKMNTLMILEKTLNHRPVTVSQKAPSASTKSGYAMAVDEGATLQALEAQSKLIDEFRNWVWEDPQRCEDLLVIFENNYGCVRPRHYDGSFLTFPGKNPAIDLYPHQRDAVARMILSPNTLLAHEVGSGKTFAMIAAGMELRRLGLSQKNLYVVPNNIAGQWAEAFSDLYPAAKVLHISPSSFAPRRRQRTLECIRDNDWDAVIMPYSCFERIKLSPKAQKDALMAQIDAINKAIEGKPKTKQLGKCLQKLDAALGALSASLEARTNALGLDELGITRLFVDEAHNYKNVPLQTKMDNVLGLNAAGSKKCQDMLDKVHCIQRQNNGGGVVFATGTPITNSVSDAYIMQRYLQSGELALVDLQSFDDWVGMFAEVCTEFEIDVDTSNYRMATRLARFHNLPELTALLSSIADFHILDDSAMLPRCEGRKDVVVPKSVEFGRFLADISARADRVRAREVPRTEDNMLLITTDGRKAALDLRLVDPQSPFTYDSKVAHCAENVADIYHRTTLQKCTQLVFCDTSTPKPQFNLYDELKSLLVQLGVPPADVGFIHDATSDRQRKELFEAMRCGDLRVLIGSTFKLGLGANVQDRLVALHHLDVPWRPADMTQREGRILRQGNLNDVVEIYRYITEGSFDAYSWQLLETKQRFIANLLSGCMHERSGSEIADTALEYGEVKALAIGNPLIKDRVEAANELNRLTLLESSARKELWNLEAELGRLPVAKRKLNEELAKLREDATFYREWKAAHPDPEGNAAIEEARLENHTLRNELESALEEHRGETRERRLFEYRGFRVVLPAIADPNERYLFLERAARHRVNLGEKKLGYLTRLNNVLDKLPESITAAEEELLALHERTEHIRQRLGNPPNYTPAIEKCRARLREIDRKLGVSQ